MKAIAPLLLDIGSAALASALAAGLSWLLVPNLGFAVVDSILLAAVTLVAWFRGFRPALLTIVLESLGLAAALGMASDSRLRLDGAGWVVLALFVAVGLAIAMVIEVLHVARRRSAAGATAARERERALELAEQASSDLAAIVESSDDAIIGKTLDGWITSWNVGAERLYGYARAEMVGRSISVLIPEDHPDELPTILARLQRGERVQHFETIRVRKDGRRVAVSVTISPIRNAQGIVVGASAIARDISGRKRAERFRNARLTVAQILVRDPSLEEAAPLVLQTVCQCVEWNLGGLWRVDREQGVLRCVDFWSKPGRSFTEFEAVSRGRTFTPGTGLPGRVWQLRAPAWIADVTQDDNFPRARVADREGLHGAFAYPIAIGGEVLAVIEFFSDRIQEPKEEILEMMEIISTQLGLFLDRKTAEGERRRLEQELRQRVEELAEADRRKNEFLATLSHELRNPLAPIRNALQVMQLADGDPAKLTQARVVMERQMEQMVRLIDDLLDVSRITWGRVELRKERVELGSVIQSAIEISGPLVEAANHQLTIRIPDNSTPVEADPTRLAQVFANLLNNAAKYTEPGGRIWLTVDRQADEVSITVKDTGIGIAPDALPRVFDMFTQVSTGARSRGGLGIGLALVRRLVVMHRGTVEAHSQGSGKGSEFVVRLPVLAPEAKAAFDGAAAPLEARSSGPGRRILVVDDNQDSADSLALMLEMQGHTTHTAYDGLAASDAFAVFDPDVILLDIGMPRMDGLEAARQIRMKPRGSEVVLVAMTGFGQDEDKRKAQEAGFDHYLTKPVHPDDLQKLLTGLSEQPA